MGGLRATTDGQLPTAVRRERIHAALKTREFMRVGEHERMFGVSAVTIPVRLQAGQNSIRFYNDTAHAPDLDRIRVVAP